MSKRRFEMYEYRQIIVRLRQGDTIRGIMRDGLANRKKIRMVHQVATKQGWLDPQSALPDDEVLAQFFQQASCATPVTKSSVLPYKTQIETWHAQGIQGSTIHAALQREHGFTGSYDSVQRFIKIIKNRSREVTTILDFKPGECAQVDFGSGPTFTNEATGEVIKTWIFVMVLAWSRHLYAEIILHQNVETWLGCHRSAFEWFGGVPKKIIIDNAKCAITRACYHDPVVQRAYSECAEGYGFMISACPPHDPKKKGRVESGVKYVKNNFVPLRDFRNQILEANRQLKAWILETASNRSHGTTREKPLTLFETERLLLKSLPDNPPECATWAKVILHSDCHVMFLKCRYSAPHTLVGQKLWLRSTETTVRIYHEHAQIAIHPRLSDPGSRHTVEEHLPPNAVAYGMHDKQWCLEEAGKIGTHCEQVIQSLLANPVVDYLRAAQGIVGLQKSYGNARLDAACRRALVFQSVHYHTIKAILKAGMEYSPLPDESSFDKLAETYTGQSRFCRNTSTLLQ